MKKEKKELLKEIANNTKDGLAVLRELAKQPETEYVLKITDDVKDGLKKGIYFLAKKKDSDELTTMVREKVGDSSELKTNLSVVAQVKDVTNYDLIATKAFQMEMRSELRAINEKLDKLDEKLTELIEYNNDTLSAEADDVLSLINRADLTNDKAHKESIIAEADSRCNKLIKFVRKRIEGKLAKFKLIPKSDVRIRVKIVANSAYKDKADKAFNEIYDLFEIYETLIRFLSTLHIKTDELKRFEDLIEEDNEWRNSLDLSKLKTISSLYPDDDLSKEWFNDFEKYNKDLKIELQGYLIRAQNLLLRELKYSKNEIEAVLEEYDDQNEVCKIKA